MNYTLRSKISFLGLVIFIWCLFFYVHASLARDLSLSEIKLLNQAYKYMQKGEYKKASDILKNYTQKNKKVHPEVFIYLANAYMMQKKYKLAIPVLTSLAKKSLKNKDVYVMLASCYYMEKDYKNAATYFKIAYNISKNVEYLYNTGLCYYLIGKKIMAYKVLKNIIKKNRNRYEWIKTYVNILLDLKKYREALTYVILLSESKIKDKKQYQEIRIQLYILLKEFSAARKYLLQILENDPSEIKWWDYLINIYLNENRYKDALAGLIIKGYLKPYTEKEKKLIADLFMQLDIPREAVKFYAKLSPGQYKDIYLTLARCYLRLDDNKRALYFLEKALKLKKTYEIYFLKGDILYRQKKFKQAMNAYVKAAKLSNKPYRAYLMAGYCALYAKKYILAKKFLKMAKKDKKLKKHVLSLIREISNMAKNGI